MFKSLMNRALLVLPIAIIIVVIAVLALSDPALTMVMWAVTALAFGLIAFPVIKKWKITTSEGASSPPTAGTSGTGRKVLAGIIALAILPFVIILGFEIIRSIWNRMNSIGQNASWWWYVIIGILVLVMFGFMAKVISGPQKKKGEGDTSSTDESTSKQADKKDKKDAPSDISPIPGLIIFLVLFGTFVWAGHGLFTWVIPSLGKNIREGLTTQTVVSKESGWIETWPIGTSEEQRKTEAKKITGEDADILIEKASFIVPKGRKPPIVRVKAFKIGSLWEQQSEFELPRPYGFVYDSTEEVEVQVRHHGEPVDWTGPAHFFTHSPGDKKNIGGNIAGFRFKSKTRNDVVVTVFYRMP